MFSEKHLKKATGSVPGGLVTVVILLAAAATLIPLAPPSVHAQGALRRAGEAFVKSMKRANFRGRFAIRDPAQDLPATRTTLLEAIRHRVELAGGVVKQAAVDGTEIVVEGWLPEVTKEKLAALARDATFTIAALHDDEVTRSLRAIQAAGAPIPDGVRLEPGEASPKGDLYLKATSEDPDKLRAFLAAHPAEGGEHVGSWTLQPPQNPGGAWRACLLGPHILSGKNIKEARAAVDPMNNTWYMAITLDEAGSKAFAEFTARSVRKRVAILVDGVIATAPTVRERIEGGRLRITFPSAPGTRATAERLAAQLQEPLPAPVELRSFERLQP